MKKIFTIICGLLLFTAVNAQFTKSGGTLLRTGSSFMTAAAEPEEPSADPPSFITSDGKTLMWFMATDSVVMDGSNLVRRWGDYLNSSRDLLQATETNQPTFITGDGGIDSYIEFNGSDNVMLTNTWSSIAVPYVVYIVFYPDTWVQNKWVYDGGTDVSMALTMYSTTPNSYRIWATGDTKIATADTWHIFRVLHNGATGSLFYVDASSGAGPTNTSGITGFTVGSNRGVNGFSHIRVKEIIVRSNDDTGDNFDDVYNYLKAKYGL